MSISFVASGCDEQVRQITLAPTPADMRPCFGKFVAVPRAGAMSRREAFALIAALKKSELAMSQCGMRLIDFYETQVDVLARGR